MKTASAQLAFQPFNGTCFNKMEDEGQLSCVAVFGRSSFFLHAGSCSTRIPIQYVLPVHITQNHNSFLHFPELKLSVEPAPRWFSS